jgi:hypothetical protein
LGREEIGGNKTKEGEGRDEGEGGEGRRRQGGIIL